MAETPSVVSMLFGILLGLLLIVGFVIVSRMVALWYFRVNHVVKLLEDINAKLGSIQSDPKGKEQG